MIEFKLSRESSLPLHMQLLDELRHKIKSGVLNAHDRLPGEWEMVEVLGISRATIQRAWQAAQDEGLLYRVVGKGTFVAGPSSAASTGESVGFFVPEYRGTFSVQMLSGAERVLRRYGYRVHVASTDRELSEENRLLQSLDTDGARGCILVPSRGDSGRVLTSPQFRVPTVLLDRPVPGAELPCVTSSNYEGGRQAMEHLVSLGHRRIVFFARPHLDLWPVAERYRAYRDVLMEVGGDPLDPVLMDGNKEMSWFEAYIQHDDAAVQPLVDLLRSPQRPTAIFAVNDWIALQTQRAITLAGLKNPADVSVVGFDDLDIAQYQNPPLTTVAQNGASMGAEAARRLMTLMEGERSEAIVTLIPTRLVVRGSTAPAP